MGRGSSVATSRESTLYKWQVIYNGGVEWANSCYMDVEQKMKPATMPHIAMAAACEHVLAGESPSFRIQKIHTYVYVHICT